MSACVTLFASTWLGGALLIWRARGFPPGLARLFAARKKKAQEKICDELTISSDDLADAIMNAKAAGRSHSSGHVQHIPEGRPLPPGAVGLMRHRGAEEPASGTMRSAFEKRKRMSWHLFEKDGAWHLLWFSGGDVADDFGGESHWEGGLHIHCTSSGFGILKDEALAAVRKRDVRLPSAHLRFELR